MTVFDIADMTSEEVQSIIDNNVYFVVSSGDDGEIYVRYNFDEANPVNIYFCTFFRSFKLNCVRYLYDNNTWALEERFMRCFAPEITFADDGKVLRANYTNQRPEWVSLLGTTITGTLNTTNFTENGAGYYKLYYTNDQMILTVASRVTSKVAMPAANGDTYDFVDFTIPQALGNKLYPIHSASLVNTGTLRNMAGAFNTGCPGYWLRIRKIDSTHIRVQVVTTVDISNPIAIGDNMQIADSTTFIL